MKSNFLIRIVGLLTELVGVLLLALYIYTCVSGYNDAAGIYIPTLEESGVEAQISSLTSQAGAFSSKLQSEQDLFLPPDTVSSKEVSSKQISSKVSSKASSKQTSSKNSSSKPVSSKESSSKLTSSEESDEEESVPSSEVSSNESEIPFESTPSSKEQVDNSFLQENIKTAEGISQKYSIPVEIASAQSGIENPNISEYAENSVDVKRGLSQVSSALASFPAEFFNQTATDISFLLVSKTVTEEIVLDNTTIIVPCFKTVNAAQLQSFILSVSSESLMSQVSVDFYPYNPQDFIYGDIKERYNYSQSIPQYGYFLSSKAQQSPEEDLYSIFMAIFERKALIKRVPTSSPLHQKLYYAFEELTGLSPCFLELDAVKYILG